MSANESESNAESGDQKRSDAGDEDDEDGNDDESDERLGVGECPAEENQRLIGGPDEVEEGPGGEERSEDDEREGMGDEREAHDEGDQGGVVDSEVGQILADPGDGVGDGVRPGHGGAVHELEPRAALREAAADGGGEARDERAEGGVGDRCGRGGGAGGGRGLGVRDRECRWRRHG